MLKEVYQALKVRLSSIVDIEELDWFLGQYLQEDGDSVLFTDKSLFIEFSPMDWQTYPKGVQKALLVFKIHAVSACLYEDEQRITDLAVDHLQFVTDIFRLLMNYRIKDGQGTILLESIVRNQTTPDHQLSPVIVTVQEFQAIIFDYSACPGYTKTTIDTITITPNIVNST